MQCFNKTRKNYIFYTIKKTIHVSVTFSIQLYINVSTGFGFSRSSCRTFKLCMTHYIFPEQKNFMVESIPANRGTRKDTQEAFYRWHSDLVFEKLCFEINTKTSFFMFLVHKQSLLVDSLMTILDLHCLAITKIIEKHSVDKVKKLWC